jgi:hypothetical protein
MAFSVGCGVANSSALLKQLNQGTSPNQIAEQDLPHSNRGSDGKISSNLVRRRGAEVQLFKIPSSKQAYSDCQWWSLGDMKFFEGWCRIYWCHCEWTVGRKLVTRHFNLWEGIGREYAVVFQATGNILLIPPWCTTVIIYFTLLKPACVFLLSCLSLNPQCYDSYFRSWYIVRLMRL